MKLLAFDYGASSGRAILGEFDGSRLTLSELHRFSSDPVMMNGTFTWDFPRLFFELKKGILKALQAGHKDIAGIGIDTWGVDFGLIGQDGQLLEKPVHYRDRRTEGMVEEVCGSIPAEELFMQSGIQPMSINTLFQLNYLVKHEKNAIFRAEKLLMMPDLFAYFLTGKCRSEFTEATTTQLIDLS